MKNTLFIVVFSFFANFCVSSCAFNKAFVSPQKFPATTKYATLKRGKPDSVRVFFSGKNYQPSYVKGQNDTLSFTYTIESLMFENDKKNKLNGFLLKPKSGKADITLYFSRPAGGLMITQLEPMLPLIDKGFNIFLIDYSGYGFSEGKGTRANVLKDAVAAVKYLRLRQDLLDTKIVIYGQSFGGNLGVVVAEKTQNLIDGLVTEGAFSSHKDIAANGGGIMARIFVKEMYSAKASVKKYKKPILIIHSSEDEVIPFRMAKTIFDNANKPKSFFEIKGKHLLGPKNYSEEIASKIRMMLK